ncbi:cytochrome-c peroxidase [Hyphomicrobium sp.]|uniref:cytochrome-c peroxidase n=1 Tax=Hyphomicrobium sp. TaxID=82 RepID=UPI003F70B09D
MMELAPSSKRLLGGVALALAFAAFQADAEPVRQTHAPAGAIGEADVSPPDRAAVWRAIFARPAGPETPETVTDDPAKIALGYDLFRDTRLSGGGATSCASCHDPARAFTDGRRTGLGPAGAGLPRNVPSLYNLAWASSFFWDGRAETLADQARGPILAENEMFGHFPTIADRLERDAAMKSRFEAVFPASTRIAEADIVDALAAYERSLVSPATRFDSWVAGNDSALDEQELRGFEIFVGKGGCVSCHGGWRFTDNGFHDVGVPGADLGRGALEGPMKGLPQFKTPSLREAVHTAPYMHDGSLATLLDVVGHYAGGHVKRPSLAPTLVTDLTLDPEEREALVAFLKTLSSERGPGAAPPETSRPVLNK